METKNQILPVQWSTCPPHLFFRCTILLLAPKDFSLINWKAHSCATEFSYPLQKWAVLTQAWIIFGLFGVILKLSLHVWAFHNKPFPPESYIFLFGSHFKSVKFFFFEMHGIRQRTFRTNCVGIGCRLLRNRI